MGFADAFHEVAALVLAAAVVGALAVRLRLIVTDALGRRATDTARLRINERGR